MSTAAFKAARDVLLAHRTDYAAACAQFRWPELPQFNWALDWFDAELARGELAHRPALRITGAHEAELTFAELSERSSRVANGLRALGIRRGDRILLMLGNVAALWEVMLAAMKLGAVILPTTTLLTAADIAERMTRAKARMIVAGAADAGKLDGLDVPCVIVGGAPGCISYDDLLRADASFVPDGPTRSNEPLLLYFTSGTTAKPKLVLHTHVSYPVGHLSTMYLIGAQPGDLHLNISSPGWAKHAYSCFFAPWNAGATVFIFNQARFHARGLLDALVAHKVTTLCAPPTVWRMLVQEDLTQWRVSLREAVGAGEPLNPEVIEQVQAAWGITVRDGYGQTETTAQIANTPGQPVKPGSMGRPLPGFRIRLLDMDDNDVEEGIVSIALDPPPVGLMQGYLNDDGTLQPFTGGLYRTGDVATRDADGYLTYVGRADDVFKASDYRISPFELESVLIEHPAVTEAAVVPAPDALRLAVPKAFVALSAGVEPSAATAGDIFRHLRERLAPYKRVRRLEFHELPKTISGKIRRVELRKLEESRTERSPGEFREEDFVDGKR